MTTVTECAQPGHEWSGNQAPHDHCPGCGSPAERHERRYTEGHVNGDKDAPLWHFVCQDCRRRWTSRDHEPDPVLDAATHRVRVLAPAEAIVANGQDQVCCGGCAGKLAEAYIGFGWDIEVRRRTP